MRRGCRAAEGDPDAMPRTQQGPSSDSQGVDRTQSPHLHLLLGNLDAHALLDEEACDALVALARVDRSEDEEDVCLGRVGDPHLCFCTDR